MFDEPDNATYSGAITGIGGTLVKTGGGALTLTGTNTYSNYGGGTIIDRGALIGTSLSLQGNILDDGQLVAEVERRIRACHRLASAEPPGGAGRP